VTDSPTGALFADIEQSRTDAARAIIASQSNKRLIVAGPGTGKSFAFQECLKACGDKGLALTFIRNLVSDLAHELDGLADVFTLHGFCKHQMHRNAVAGLQTDWDYYPQLLELLVQDLQVLGRPDTQKDQLERCLHNLDNANGTVTDVLGCGGYYNAVSHTDLVFRVVKHFQDDDARIPRLPLIVVDEYQDFSLLETTFIGLLADKSPILIAGDDDQALYAFKNASARYIRELAGDEAYEQFSLPYCSRCTQVVVDAVNNTITAAKADGHLEDRLAKEFKCFLPSKLEESEAHPRIIHARCSVERRNAPYGGRYIAKQIREIPIDDVHESREDGYPTALVIGPKPFLGQAYETLKAQFPQTTLKVAPKQEVEILDGYRRIAENEASRLGWRIVMYCDPFDGDHAILDGVLSDDGDLALELPDAYRAPHMVVVALVRKLLDGEPLEADEEASLSSACGQPIGDITHALNVGDDDEVAAADEPGEDEPSIICTSLVGAKGLSASHVFVVGFNNEHFPRDASAITDEEICCFLVALSRTRKQCHLISCRRLGNERREASHFARWITDELENVNVNAAYFAS
jgi:hypothetical protein